MLQQVQKRLSLDSVYDVPCFECLSRKTISEVECNPKKCVALDFWVNV
jgi:hypothetical protein